MTSQSSNNYTIEDIYRGVINDVVNQVREAFLDESVDIDVLQQLKKSWETKVNESGALCLDGVKNLPPPAIRQAPSRQPPMKSTTSDSTISTNIITEQVDNSNSSRKMASIIQLPSSYMPTERRVISVKSGAAMNPNATHISQAAQLLSTLSENSSSSSPTYQLVSTETVTNGLQQYTLMPMQGAPNVMIVSGSNQQFLQGTSIQQPIFSTVRQHQPKIVGTKTEPTSSYNINQLDGTGTVILLPNNDKKNQIGNENKASSTTIEKSDAVKRLTRKMKKIPQLDGGPGMTDSSSESDVDEDNDDPLNRFASFGGNDKPDSDEVVDVDEEPLNSDDDQSDDEDLETLFDADNVVICQFEKVHRARNKWKFVLKDGIMHIKGKDYCFQKGTGEAEW